MWQAQLQFILQNRTGLSNCGPFPIDGPAPQGAANLSTCPDRVGRYLKATAILDRLLGIDGFDSQSNRIVSNNRFLWSVRVPTAPNPLVAHRFFIWNQYQDFLNREPDNGGMNFYAAILDGCLNNQECIKDTRATLSGNFFRSPEFGERGAYIANLYNIVYGQRPKTPEELNLTSKVERPRFNEFIADLQAIAGTNVSALKTTLALNWLNTRDDVKAILPSTMTHAAFVARLELTAGLTLPNRTDFINALTSGSQSRAQVLRAIAEHPDVVNKFVLQNFVTMQYIGHLRRAPEDCHNSPVPSQCGYIFHYNRFGPGLDQHTVQTLITRGFIESPEYQRRFGPPF